MKTHGLKAIIPKKKHYYPDAGSDSQYAPHLLARQFTPKTVATHLVGDITYIRRYEGWCYLACVLDLGSREIVGYATSRTPDSELAKTALDNALKHMPIIAQQILFHSDQGANTARKHFVNT